MQEIMKTFRSIAVATAVFIAMMNPVIVRAETAAEKSFQQLAALEGDWVGKGSEGQNVEVSFRMTAGGSALMSEIHGHGHEHMITMFDGNHSNYPRPGRGLWRSFYRGATGARV
jgi:hypothetical protein